MKNLLNKGTKGITLIALVVTIVILIILAGVLVNITIGDNGLFTKAKLAKLRYEYATAKEIVDIKLVDIQAECITEKIDYDLKKISEEMTADTEITIEQMYLKPTSLIKEGINPTTYTNLKGIVVSANVHPQFKFLIGEEGKVIGVTTKDIPEEWEGDLPDGFLPPEDFEKTLEPSGPTEGEVIEDGEITGFTVSKNIATLSRNTTFTIKGTSTSNDIDKVELKIGDITVYAESDLKSNSYNKTVRLNNLTNLDQINYGETYSVKAILTQKNNETTEASTENILNKTVGNATSLKKIANIVNGTNEETQSSMQGEEILQVADIALNQDEQWIIIGNSEYWFKGTYDGNNYQITNIKINNSSARRCGFFDYIDENTTLKNIRVSGTIQSSATNITGGLVGWNDGGTIENCENAISVTNNQVRYVGGIAGRNQGIIRRCSNSGNIVGFQKVGGICGISETGSTLVGCTNSGNVTAVSNIAGGIAGLSDVDITRCLNTGNITSQSDPQNDPYIETPTTRFDCQGTGGIVGRYGANISRCSNSGIITTEGFFGGGIAGFGFSEENTTISECWNTGKISKSGNRSGGIVGAGWSVENCYTYLKNEKSFNCGNLAGGIAGVSTNIVNCYCIMNNPIFNGAKKGVIAASVQGRVINKEDEEVKVDKVSNCYYIAVNNVAGVYESSNLISNETTEKTEPEFKSTGNGSVVALLNTNQSPAVWGIDDSINDGYPYLVNNH